MRNGVRLAATEINDAGGILGRPILLVERDDEAKNERGIQVVQELVNKEHVSAALGFVNTGVALAAQRYFEEAQIPVIDNVAAGTKITHQFEPPEYPDNFVFRISPYDAIQAEAIVRDAVDRSGFRKVAILADSTNYGQLGRVDLEASLARRGLKPQVEEKFNIKDVDMTAQLLRAKEAGAQAVLLYGIGPELAQIANGMQKLGWKVPMIGCWSLAFSNFIDNAGPNGDGARMPQTFIQAGTTSPRGLAFIRAYQIAYKVDRIPTAPQAAQGYDSMYVLAAAIRQAGSVDGQRIREALEDLHDWVDGVVKTYDRPFSHTNHEAIKPEDVVLGEVRSGWVVRAN
jgi:branched-chain amino acid transport system substrate-binding protein